MANEHPDFRIVYYDDLNGYYKMSPVSFVTLADAKKVVEIKKKRANDYSDNAWGIVQVQHIFGED